MMRKEHRHEGDLELPIVARINQKEVKKGSKRVELPQVRERNAGRGCL